MTIEMKPVTSSNIAEVGHGGGKLRVKFRDGSTYEYHGVDADVFKEMSGAESVGKFFAQRIKGHHKATKL